MLEVGALIDRYVVEAENGEGGIAHVFRVRHRTLRTLHALKILKVGGRALCERLVQEGQLQAAITHPNIVAVTDVLEVEGSPGLLMEYVEGGALDRWLEGNRPELADAERLFRGILAGVGRAHRDGLVHRDLKPGNILLGAGEGGLVPKVADFGLAKILMDIPGGANSATRSGVGMGTPAYMSPEQVRNAKGVDQRTDVFALGCILYELVCGRSPFDAPDVLQIFAALSTGKYQPPEEVVPHLPAALRRVIRASLAIQRDDRPPDCATMLAMLDDRSPDDLPFTPPFPRPPPGLQGAAIGLSSGPLATPHSVRLSAPPTPTGRTPAATFVVPGQFDERDRGVSGSLVEVGPKRSKSSFSTGERVGPGVLGAQSVVIGLGVVAFAGLALVLIGIVSVLWYNGQQPAAVLVTPARGRSSAGGSRRRGGRGGGRGSRADRPKARGVGEAPRSAYDHGGRTGGANNRATSTGRRRGGRGAAPGRARGARIYRNRHRRGRRRPGGADRWRWHPAQSRRVDPYRQVRGGRDVPRERHHQRHNHRRVRRNRHSEVCQRDAAVFWLDRVELTGALSALRSPHRPQRPSARSARRCSTSGS